jgi:hypothetical protein
MSGYQHREGMGSMLANNKAADNHPDWRGDFMLNGTLYEIAGWAGTTAGGKGRISLKVQPQRDRQPAASQPAREAAPKADMNDDIPF